MLYKFNGMEVIDISAHVKNMSNHRNSVILITLEQIMREIEGEDYMERIEEIKPRLGKKEQKGVFGREVHYTIDGVTILIDPLNMRQPLRRITFKDIDSN